MLEGCRGADDRIQREVRRWCPSVERYRAATHPRRQTDLTCSRHDSIDDVRVLFNCGDMAAIRHQEEGGSGFADPCDEDMAFLFVGRNLADQRGIRGEPPVLRTTVLFEEFNPAPAPGRKGRNTDSTADQRVDLGPNKDLAELELVSLPKLIDRLVTEAEQRRPRDRVLIVLDLLLDVNIVFVSERALRKVRHEIPGGSDRHKGRWSRQARKCIPTFVMRLPDETRKAGESHVASAHRHREAATLQRGAMPELPEVEIATRLARAAAVGRTIERVDVLHPSHQKKLPPKAAASLAGERIIAIERRGKYQAFRLESGRALGVHFRMTGDWVVVPEASSRVAPTSSPSEQTFARVILHFDNGAQLVLRDSRALATVLIYDAGIDPFPTLGPEATDTAFSALALREALRGRRAPIKVALLDQRVVAGVGNIYASEALWYAKVSPKAVASRLSLPRLHRVVVGVRRAMAKALHQAERYYGEGGPSDAVRFNVYDREGLPCRRCSTPIMRIVQAQRSTYFCSRCQR